MSNPQAILIQMSYPQLIVEAYDNFLKETALSGKGNSELAVHAMMGSHLVRSESHSITVQGYLGGYAQKQSGLSQDGSVFGAVKDAVAGTSSAEDFVKESLSPNKNPSSRKVDDIGEKAAAIDRTISGAQPDYIAPFNNVTRPADENLYQDWIGDHLGVGFESIKSNLGKILEGDIDSDTLTAWLEECIPCMERFNDIRNLRPWDDFLDLLKNDLNKRLTLLDDILNLFNNTEIINDICALARFLTFMCIPDLIGIIAALKALAAKLLDILKLSLAGALWILLSALLYPFIQGLLDLLKKYIDVFLSAIICILDAIFAQMMKIPGLQDETLALMRLKEKKTKEYRHKIQRYIQTQPNPPNPIDPNKPLVPGAAVNPNDVWGNQPWPKEPDPSTTYIEAWGALDYLNSALGHLAYGVAEAVSYITGLVLWLENIVKEFISKFTNGLQDAINAGKNMLRLARLIGIVMAIIRLKQGRALCPGGEQDFGLPDWVTILNDYNSYNIASNNLVIGEVNGKPGYYIVSPEDKSAGIIRDNFGNIVGHMKENKISYTQNLPAQESGGATGSIKRAVIVDSCIKSPSLGGDAKIKQWLAELQVA